MTRFNVSEHAHIMCTITEQLPTSSLHFLPIIIITSQIVPVSIFGSCKRTVLYVQLKCAVILMA